MTSNSIIEKILANEPNLSKEQLALANIILMSEKQIKDGKCKSAGEVFKKLNAE